LHTDADGAKEAGGSAGPGIGNTGATIALQRSLDEAAISHPDANRPGGVPFCRCPGNRVECEAK
jgi:hypothetical protein